MSSPRPAQAPERWVRLPLALYTEMNRTKGIDRPELAIVSGKNLPSFFRKYPNMLKVIDYIEKSGLKDKLYFFEARILLRSVMRSVLF